MRRTLPAALAIASAALLVPATAAQAAPAPIEVSLPAPPGPLPVGTLSMHLVDHSRPDPLREPEQPFRELMVSAYYPAGNTAGHPVVPRFQPGAAAAYDDFAGPGNAGVPSGLVDWAGTATHAHGGAPAAATGDLPVLLYSPGAGDPRATNTALVEDLASRGYLVLTIDHTYESAGVEFPGGRVERTVLPDRLPADGPPPESLLRTVIGARVADTRFVLDRLGEIGARIPGLAGRIDREHIGMFGHSGGGFTAMQAMHDDPRIKAAADFDGLLAHAPEDDGSNPSSVATDGVDRPFLLFGAQPGGHTSRPSWGSAWSHSTGWRGDLLLGDAAHASFTDVESLLPQIAARTTLPRPAAEQIGTVDPARALCATRAYTASFFDRFLRNWDNGLLDGPSAEHPEVSFIR